ncbi:MAG TPA: putative peptidoglycan glycosyltransferase FtsW, partial [Acidimicrobiales bacterium]|nr:putative peptidoglycan glycosyltransferase FtsW [Acidimicrobiales bacterium]
MRQRQRPPAGGRGQQGRQGGLSVVAGGAGAGSLAARLGRLGDRGGRRGGSQAGSPGSWSSNPVLLAALVSVLCVIGLVMVLSASSVESLSQHGSSWYVFEHQVVWEALGTALLVAASRADYHRYRRLAVPFLLICLVLLVAVLAPSLGKTVSGSTRWLGVGPLRLQPSELAKAALVLFGADVLARRTGRDQRWGPAVRPVLIVTAVIALLVLAQPDMGTALILGAIAMGLLCAAGAPKRVIGGVIGVGVAAGFLVAVAKPYRRARLLSFLDPWVHRHNSGYQVVQSLVGFANGHLFGVGLGASRAKWGFLPNAHTDFIFTIIGEELGL